MACGVQGILPMCGVYGVWRNGVNQTSIGLYGVYGVGRVLKEEYYIYAIFQTCVVFHGTPHAIYSTNRFTPLRHTPNTP